MFSISDAISVMALLGELLCGSSSTAVAVAVAVAGRVTGVPGVVCASFGGGRD